MNTAKELDEERDRNKRSKQANLQLSKQLELLTASARRVEKFASSTAAKLVPSKQSTNTYRDKVRHSLESDVSEISKLLHREHQREAEMTLEREVYPKVKDTE